VIPVADPFQLDPDKKDGSVDDLKAQYATGAKNHKRFVLFVVQLPLYDPPICKNFVKYQKSVAKNFDIMSHIFEITVRGHLSASPIHSNHERISHEKIHSQNPL
jgi:hypothetical protein